MASSGFDRAFDDLIHRRRPAWHLVGADRRRLIDAAIAWLTPERVRSFDASTAASRAAWVLDRLLPMSEAGLLRRLNGYERWLYTLHPLFRRSPADMDSVTLERYRAGESHAVEAAWVETRATDADLLGWNAECVRRGWPPGSPPLATVEYCRRAPEPDRLLRHLDDASPGEVAVILHCLMRLVAPSMPRTAEPEPGLVGRLRRAGFDAVADAVAERIMPAPEPIVSVLDTGSAHPDLWESSLASTLWTEQQGPDDVDGLARGKRMDALPRLSQVLPHDRADVWERVRFRAGPPDHDWIEALCAWCTPDDRHLLPPHFGHGHLASAACAFETYLALAPAEEVARMAQDAGRPAWQAELLDRWMHAPPELRPPRPRVRRPHEIVFDLRAYDPFDVRFEERP